MERMKIGQRIKTVRESAHITQEELAKAVGCTAKHIGAIERGIKTPSLETFVAIANTTGASADVLLQDVLENSAESITNDLSSAGTQLSPHMQKRFLKALRVFAEDNIE